MWVYYQTAENAKQSWKIAKAEESEGIRVNDAYHFGIYQLDNPPEAVEQDEIKYKGDLWFDIDHKPDSDNPTQDEINQSLYLAILDLRRLLSWFEAKGANLDYLTVFASGSKGFHVKVPSSLYGFSGVLRDLPLIHKGMATVIKEESGATGLDLQIYCIGKGRLLRVENKQRSNGKYKVQVPRNLFDSLTPEQYNDLTSSPRPVSEVQPPKSAVIDDLAILFAAGKKDIKEARRFKDSVVASELLEEFVEESPTCVNWLIDGVNVVDDSVSGRFNQAKMSLARYLMSAPLSDEARESAIQRFADKWESSQNKTPEARVRALRAALPFGKEKGFSCSMMQKMLVANPCEGCPVKKKQVDEAFVSDSEIIETTKGYCKEAARGQIVALTNFILTPVCKYEKSEDGKDSFEAYDYAIIEDLGNGPERKGTLTIDSSSWLTARDFRKILNSKNRLHFLGNDIDLQKLKTHLTSQNLVKDIQVIKSIKTVGVYRHIDDSRDIDEYVWVEPRYSVNPNGLPDTIKFTGMNLSEGTICLNMKSIPDLVVDEKFSDLYKSFLKSQKPETVAAIVGWMSACWLKIQLIEAMGMEKHFPVLSLWGLSGAGKTQTACLYSLLAGANYCSASPTMVSGATPFTLMTEGSISTTVPRILDEFNKQKIPDVKKYTTAREVIKASASCISMPQGTLGRRNHALSGSSVQIDNRVMTSPLVMLATEENQEKELQERVVSLLIDDIGKSERYPHFLKVNADLDRLYPLAKLLMRQALMVSREWAKETLLANNDLINPDFEFRTRKNWLVPMSGLDFLVYTLERAGFPEDLLEPTRELKSILIKYLNDESDYITGKTKQHEIEVIIDQIGELATIPNGMGDFMVKDGMHYLVQDGVLHLFMTACFSLYFKYMKDMSQVPQMTSVKQFKALIRNQPYYIGSGVAPGVKNAGDWFSFKLDGLEERGVHVERFLHT